MDILGNLNILATIGSFGCVSFALSGIGVKLGKFNSSPHTLGFKYISENQEEGKADKFYDATAKINKHLNTSAPEWAKDKEQLKQWCKDYEKSTRNLVGGSQHCLIRKNVWHRLIEDGLTVNEPTEQASTSGTETNNEKCTYEILSRYANGENASYLIGKKLCTPNGITPSTTSSTSVQSVQRR